jgi:hypothetical protein
MQDAANAADHHAKLKPRMEATGSLFSNRRVHIVVFGPHPDDGNRPGLPARIAVGAESAQGDGLHEGFARYCRVFGFGEPRMLTASLPVGKYQDGRLRFADVLRVSWNPESGKLEGRLYGPNAGAEIGDLKKFLRTAVNGAARTAAEARLREIDHLSGVDVALRPRFGAELLKGPDRAADRPSKQAPGPAMR